MTTRDSSFGNTRSWLEGHAEYQGITVCDASVHASRMICKGYQGLTVTAAATTLMATFFVVTMMLTAFAMATFMITAVLALVAFVFPMAALMLFAFVMLALMLRVGVVVL